MPSYDDDDFIEDYGSLSRDEQFDAAWDLFGGFGEGSFQDKNGDLYHDLMFDAIYNDAITPEGQQDAREELEQLMRDEYNIEDFWDVWDWDHFREVYG